MVSTAAAVVLAVNVALIGTVVVAAVDVRGVESNVLYFLQKGLVGERLYTDPEALPYAINQYPPVYYWVTRGALRLLQIDPTDVLALRVVSRLVSVGALIGIGVIGYRLLRTSFRLAPRDATITISAAVAISLPWFALSRPDALAAFFAVAAVAACVRFVEEQETSMLVLASTMAALSLLTKQSGLWVVVALFVVLLLQRDARGVVLHAATVAAVVLAVLGAAVFNAGAVQDLPLNLVDGVRNGFDLTKAISKSYQFALLEMGLLVGLGLATALWASWRSRSASAPISGSLTSPVGALGLSGAVGLAILGVAALKVGSAVHYFIEPAILLVMFWSAVVFLPIPSRESLRNGARVLLVIGALVPTIYHVAKYAEPNVQSFRAADAADASLDEVVALVDRELAEGAFVLTNDREVGLRLPDVLAVPQPDIVNCCARPLGVFDYTTVCEHMQTGRIGVLVLEGDVPERLNGCPLAPWFTSGTEIGGLVVIPHRDSDV